MLNAQDLKPQQAVRVDLRRVWRHGGDNVAFGFYIFVALKTDEVGDGLAGLQSGKEMDTLVTGAESGRGEKRQSGDRN